jgi:hypothetical protein
MSPVGVTDLGGVAGQFSPVARSGRWSCWSMRQHTSTPYLYRLRAADGIRSRLHAARAAADVLEGSMAANGLAGRLGWESEHHSRRTGFTA